MMEQLKGLLKKHHPHNKEGDMDQTTHGANGSANEWLTGRDLGAILDEIGSLFREARDVYTNDDIEKNNLVRDLQGENRTQRNTIHDLHEQLAKANTRADEVEASFRDLLGVNAQLQEVEPDPVEEPEPDPIEVPEPSALRKERIANARKTINWDDPNASRLEKLTKELEQDLLRVATYDDNAITVLKDLAEAAGFGIGRGTTATSVKLRLLGLARRSVTHEGFTGPYPKAMIGIKLNGSDGKLPGKYQFVMDDYEMWDHWLEHGGYVTEDEEATIRFCDLKELMSRSFGKPRKDILHDWLQERGFYVNTTHADYAHVHGLKAVDR